MMIINEKPETIYFIKSNKSLDEVITFINNNELTEMLKHTSKLAHILDDFYYLEVTGGICKAIYRAFEPYNFIDENDIYAVNLICEVVSHIAWGSYDNIYVIIMETKEMLAISFTDEKAIIKHNISYQTNNSIENEFAEYTEKCIENKAKLESDKLMCTCFSFQFILVIMPLQQGVSIRMK